MCDTKAEECARLRTLQLTDRSVADPALPTKLQETENYLKLCTEAFHKLKSDAMTMESTLSRQLTESREQAGDFVRQLEAARSETVNATQQLTISQLDLTHAQGILDSRGHGDSLSDRTVWTPVNSRLATQTLYTLPLMCCDLMAQVSRGTLSVAVE